MKIPLDERYLLVHSFYDRPNRTKTHHTLLHFLNKIKLWCHNISKLQKTLTVIFGINRLYSFQLVILNGQEPLRYGNRA